MVEGKDPGDHVNEPQFDIEPTEAPEAAAQPVRRTYIGWALLILFFAYYVPKATYAAVTRKAGPGESYVSMELGLKQAMAMRQALKSFAPKTPNLEDLSSLDDTVSGLVEPARKDPEAAMVYIAMRREQGRAYAFEYLDVLRKSNSDEYKTFAEIYGTEHLTTQEAARLAGQLKGSRFIYQLARAEAFSRAGDNSAKTKLTPASTAFAMMFAALGLAALLLVGLALWGVYFAARVQGKLKPEGHPVGVLTRAVADLFAVRAVQLIVMFLVVPMLVRTAGDHLTHSVGGKQVSALSNPVLNIISGLLIIVGTFVLMGFSVGGIRINAASLGITARDLGRRFLWALAGVVADVPAIMVAALVGLSIFRFLPAPEHPATEMLKNAHDPLAILSLFFLASIQAPIFEEILFRGILFPALSTVLKGPIPGAVASSLMFASLHPQGPAAWLGLATVGAMNCFLTYQTRSLVPAMILHCLHNGVLLLLTLTMF